MDEHLELVRSTLTELDTAVEIEQLFRAGDDVIQVGRSVGSVHSTGHVLDVPECHIWTIRDGTIHAARFYIDSSAVMAALDRAAAG